MDDIDNLIELMARLRDPDAGCPWDLAQNFETIAPYTIEEAYEVAEAIRQGDMDGLREELGDLLLQVVFHARMAEEAGHFDFAAVVAAITDKLVRRHPHVFGDAPARASAQSQQLAWERHKDREAPDRGVLGDIPLALPALKRAQKLQKRAAAVGFDWPDAGGALEKVREEMRELEAELVSGDATAQFRELGDVLFALTNLGRKLGFDTEAALRQGNGEFERRFGHIEQRLAEDGRRPESASLEEMDALWDEAKAAE